MSTLIIYAHPKTEGHCSTILKEVQNRLKAKSISYEVLNLYKMKYDPVLHEKEHYTARGKFISKQNTNIQKKILGTTELIFIYPIWWGSMPAILKGFFDRILTPNFAFKFSERGIPIKLLKDKKAKIFVTSGSPKWFFLVTLLRPYKLIQNDILGFCGIKSKVYHIANAKTFDDKKKLETKNIVAKALK